MPGLFCYSVRHGHGTLRVTIQINLHLSARTGLRKGYVFI